ncbi:MAG: 3-isopropylmalate dehydrogenase [Chloroflexota bacterium]|nr:MAG: 3-isopropylmalate dehydrogenase [Chloroflexota bacterium]
MEAFITVLPGDGIGPEVTGAAIATLTAVADHFGHHFEFDDHLLGGNAIDRTGTALPGSTLEACLQADAIMLGAVGGPKWDDPTADVRPEQGLLGLRKALALFANLRPVKPHPDLLAASPLRPDRLHGVDLLVVRELTGGIYFGQPQERRYQNGETVALDTMVYGENEISRVARLAFEAARNRKGEVTSVDKANVLESSRLWRQTVSQVAHEYPDVTLEHLLVDAAAMHLITRPATFDVIVTANLFGDILTDEASVLSGSMGNLPSASLGETKNRLGYPRGLFEPIHGSAPDIAGQGLANPIGAILSAALLLRHSLGLETEAKALEQAIGRALADGHRTADLVGQDSEPLTTVGMSEVILNNLAEGTEQ